MNYIYVSIPETPNTTHFTSQQFPSGTVLVNTAAQGILPRVGRLGLLPPDVVRSLLSLRGKQYEESYPYQIVPRHESQL